MKKRLYLLPRISFLAFTLTAADRVVSAEFVDVTQQAGIDAHHYFGDDDLSNIVEGTGAGAAFFDFDGDGWLDIYLLNGCWLSDVDCWLIVVGCWRFAVGC